MILGLRLMSGISVDEFASRFAVTVDDAFGAALTRHLGLGLLAREGDRIRLTERGMLLANEVFVDLLPDPAD
jgi:oxygen-independent coproporphyrinogen-3 oxidase